MSTAARLLKEYEGMLKEPMTGIEFEETKTFQPQRDGFVEEWMLVVEGAKGSLYAGETYRLRFRFTSNYPFEAPEVEFMSPSPCHPHIYTNGHICLSILYDEWSPALTATHVCLSIVSMMSSCTEKIRPEGNDRYVSRAPNSSKKSRWIFHDHNC
mmetsp:Transcript_33207/g.38672  ORF Transcript_33207/g.38672 Transcript_33207/m.38672 type:complete len:155 (+) Transcript_33207:317-781(+)